MDIPTVRTDPRIEKFLRYLSKGELLFREGDPGTTMFVVIQGSVELVEMRGVAPLVFATLRAGEIFGEKALLSGNPYHRSFGVRAAEETVVMEFSTENIPAFTPIPRAIASTATAVNPGFRPSIRNPYRMSCHRICISSSYS